MKRSYTLCAFICTFAIALISVPDLITQSSNDEAEHAHVITSENVMPAQFVYIRFSGESSQMIQLKDVEGVISERLSEFSVER